MFRSVVVCPGQRTLYNKQRCSVPWLCAQVSVHCTTSNDVLFRGCVPGSVYIVQLATMFCSVVVCPGQRTLYNKQRCSVPWLYAQISVHCTTSNDVPFHGCVPGSVYIVQKMLCDRSDRSIIFWNCLCMRPKWCFPQLSPKMCCTWPIPTIRVLLSCRPVCI